MVRTTSRVFPAATALLLALLSASDLQAKKAGSPAPPDSSAKPAAASAPAQQPKTSTAPAATSNATTASAKPCNDAAAADRSRHRRDVLLIEFLCAGGVLLVLYPIGRFLFRQWSFRADRLFGELAGDPIVYYYVQFRPGKGPAGAAPQKLAQPVNGNWYAEGVWQGYLQSFKQDFYSWYGRRYYIAPVLMLALLTAASACWAQQMLRAWATVSGGPGTGLRALTASALAGAFVWIISDEVDRLRRLDFTTSDIYYYVFRILLCIPFAWALAFVKDTTNGTIYGVPAAIPLAFFLGAFPTTTLFTIARRIGSQQLKLGDDPQTGNELEKLQAVTKSNAERFRDEGISTITELAYSDPIDLTIRTNLNFSYVVDCVSQALSWIYFGDNSAKLFALSLRGAQEIASVANDLTSADQATADQADATLDAAADVLGVNPAAFRSTINQIANDPYTQFLVNVWS